MTTRIARSILAALAALAVAAGFAVLASRSFVRNDDTRPAHEQALAPRRRLTVPETVLARAINAVDYDMRSLELGEWIVSRVRSGGCGTDAWAIASALPRLNDVARAEVQRHVAYLLRVSCALGLQRTMDDLDRELDPASGVLAGMPGYSARSRVALPA